jgi:hypothetical protein
MNRNVAITGIAVAIGTLFMQHRAGATPLSRRWSTAAFRRDARANDLTTVLRIVGPRDGIVAPDYVLAHVAERPDIGRLAPDARGLEWYLFSSTHRLRFAGSQDLWRSAEEAPVRNFLNNPRYALVSVSGQQLLFRRGAPQRSFARGRYVDFAPEPDVHADHLDAGAHVFVAGWALRPHGSGSLLVLLFSPRESLPFDLGLEAGYGPMHANGDREDPAHVTAALPFDGLFSPAYVRVGEVARTTIELDDPPDVVLRDGLYIGTRRIDGSRLDADGPHWIRLRATQ